MKKAETTAPTNNSTEDEREPTKEELEAEFSPNDKGNLISNFYYSTIY